jgi:hypothetical protein
MLSSLQVSSLLPLVMNRIERATKRKGAGHLLINETTGARSAFNIWTEARATNPGGLNLWDSPLSLQCSNQYLIKSLLKLTQPFKSSLTSMVWLKNVSASEKRSHSRRCWPGPVIHQSPLVRTRYVL